MRTGNTIGLLVLIGIAAYTGFSIAQSRVANKLCDRYTVGSTIEDPSDLDGTLLLTRMGPFDVQEKPGTQRVMYCAGLTMCDSSCTLEIRDHVVTDARTSNL